jgi:hypothetical protein
MVLREHGTLDKLRFETDFPDPEAGEGDVVLRVWRARSTITTSSLVAGCQELGFRCP